MIVLGGRPSEPPSSFSLRRIGISVDIDFAIVVESERVVGAFVEASDSRFRRHHPGSNRWRAGDHFLFVEAEIRAGRFGYRLRGQSPAGSVSSSSSARPKSGSSAGAAFAGASFEHAG